MYKQTSVTKSSESQKICNQNQKDISKENSIDSTVIDLVKVQVQAPPLRPGVDEAVLPSTGSPTQGPSYSGIVSGGKTVPHVVMDVHASSQSLSAVTPVFRTPMPDGPHKNEIVVEVHSLNGCQYNGTVTVSKARISIFEEVLGFEQDDLASLTIGYDRGHIITYKLKHK